MKTLPVPSVDRLLTLSPQYVKVTCLTHRNWRKGGGGKDLDAWCRDQ